MEDQLRQLVEDEDFSGAVRVDRDSEPKIEFARGWADRANERPNRVDTRFAIASGTKALTALTIMSMIESGDLARDQTVRSIMGDDLPQVHTDVTIDHLLGHVSGIGDYIDEEIVDDIDDLLLGSLSPQQLATPWDYLGLINAHPHRTEPGATFAYNNSGYVVLSMVIEKLAAPFHQSVMDRVVTPAQMTSSGFFRSDNLPPNCALGYLQNGHTNVFHLPVTGAGDGGAYLTAADTLALWDAFLDDKIVSAKSRAIMTAPSPQSNGNYGRGFWLKNDGDYVALEGMDAGVSFATGVVQSTGDRYVVLSNTSSGVWALVKAIEEHL